MPKGQTCEARCPDLTLGVYLVKQVNATANFAICGPFLVTVPIQNESGFEYDVNASPKLDAVRLITITIQVVWNVGDGVQIPNSVTVQLLKDGEVIETAILSKENNWQIAYDAMLLSDDYDVKVIDLPAGFTSTYSQKEFIFTVVNTSSLAQTGQLIWPIPVLSMAGLAFLLAGFALLRKSEDRRA